MKSIITFLVLTISLCSALKHQNCYPYLNELEQQAVDNGVKLPSPKWFSQRLDHFNGQERRFWNQRYYVNDTFFNPSVGGPIFFQIGGEGAISPGYVTFLEMVHYAQHHGALLVALEHRYYGESHPLDTMTTENLQYLNSQQALADAAFFLSAFKKDYNLPQDHPVVSFGCSYPGALAAWFRIKYPHATIGSVASSAPVEAVLDFFEYLDVVEQSIEYFVGKQCDQLIGEATKRVQTLLKTSSGRAILEDTFNTCEKIVTDADVSTFMSNLMGDFQGVVQYNNEMGPNKTVDYVCNIMTQGAADPLKAYAKVAAGFYSPCMDVSYANLVKQSRDISNFGNNTFGLRQWTYQSCNEFGYFQTTDSDNQPFGNLVPISYWVQSCIDIFDVDLKPAERVEETNIYYGGRNIPADGATNILFVNGNIDPWHSLSVTESISDSVQAILIDGTAHCRNISPPGPDSPPGLVKAQQQTAEIISGWLN